MKLETLVDKKVLIQNLVRVLKIVIDKNISLEWISINPKLNTGMDLEKINVIIRLDNL